MHPQLAVRSEEVLSEITAMWADIGNSLQIFEAYKEFIDRDVSLQEALFDVLVELLLFGVFTIKTIKFMKVYPGYSTRAQVLVSKYALSNFLQVSCPSLPHGQMLGISFETLPSGYLKEFGSLRRNPRLPDFSTRRRDEVS
jgi:hypothetical protein